MANPAHGAARSRCGDVRAQPSGADDDDVAQVVAAAAELTQEQSDAAAHDKVCDEREHEPVRGPDAREVRAGLAEEQEREPGAAQAGPPRERSAAPPRTR